MGVFTLGGLTSVPAASRTSLLAPAVLDALTVRGLLDDVGVVEIDPGVSDTAATRERFGLDAATLANCVVVGGRREGAERIAACVVLSTTRADVNGTVRRLLDVRKASFLPMDRCRADRDGVRRDHPHGLPADWPVLVDARVGRADVVIVGSGVRRSKILVPGRLLAALPQARIVDGSGRRSRQDERPPRSGAIAPGRDARGPFRCRPGVDPPAGGRRRRRLLRSRQRRRWCGGIRRWSPASARCCCKPSTRGARGSAGSPAIARIPLGRLAGTSGGSTP